MAAGWLSEPVKPTVGDSLTEPSVEQRHVD